MRIITRIPSIVFTLIVLTNLVAQVPIRPVYSWNITAQEYEKSIKKSPKYQLALDWIEEKKYKPAIALLKNILLNQNPDSLSDFHIVYLELGTSYSRIGQPNDAETAYLSGLQLARAKRDSSTESKILTRMGILKQYISDYPGAINYFNQAITVAKLCGYKSTEALAKTNLAVVYRNVGRLSEALTYHEQALELAEEIGEEMLVGQNVGNIGSIHFFMNEFSTALQHYEKAVEIHKRIGENILLATWYTNIGLCYWNLNEYSTAQKYLEIALGLHESNKNGWETSRTLAALGQLFLRLGNLTRALQLNKEALTIAQELGNRSGECRGLGVIGNIQNTLGNTEIALEYYRQAAEIANQIGDKYQLGSWIGNIGTCYHSSGNYEKAIEYYQKSMVISEEMGNFQDQAIFLQNIGQIYTEQKRYNEADYVIEKALQFARKTSDKGTESEILLQLATLATRKNNFQDAVQYNEQALRIAESIKEPMTVWQIRASIANVSEKMGKMKDALTNYQLAIQEIESLRNYLLTDEHKTAFMQDKLSVYEKTVVLLYDMYQLGKSTTLARESFLYSERAKARALMDIVSEGKLLQSVDAVPEQYKKQMFTIDIKLDSLYKAFAAENGKSESEQDAKNIFNMNREIENLHVKRSENIANLKKQEPRFYNLTNPHILNVDEIQQSVLTDNQVLIEFMVTDEQTFAWYISKNHFKFHKLETTRQQLKDMFAEVSPIFRKDLIETDSQVDHRWADIKPDKLFELYKVVLKDVDFVKPSMEMIIIPDDIMHYFPFEMLVTELSEGKARYLIEDHPISYMASASLLSSQLESKRKKTGELLAFGNPSFSVKNNKFASWWSGIFPNNAIRNQSRFMQLPFSEVEVKEVAKNFSQPKIFIDKSATESNFKNYAGEYDNVHLATHNVVDDRQPMYSKIIFSQDLADEGEDGFLQTYEVYNLRLNADLVVLSGCNSALGKLNRGEGLIGMTRAFLYAGASSLVVSLWPVNDESTAELMKHFYQNLKAGLGKNKALQFAKIAMLQSNNWKQDPFYWSAFVLLGNMH